MRVTDEPGTTVELVVVVVDDVVGSTSRLTLMQPLRVVSATVPTSRATREVFLIMFMLVNASNDLFVSDRTSGCVKLNKP